MEALRLIKESGLPHRRTLSVVVFTSEEPTRFGMGCLGSRALAGALTREDLSTLIDREGESLESLLLRLGYDLSQYGSVKRAKGDVHGFVELHIEQGAVLESLKIGIGVVTTISAPTDLTIKVKGRQGHAGATPMRMRCDALAAAAEIILKLEALATAEENPSTVATVGKLSVYPGASNVIPGAAEFTTDIRSSDFESKARLLEQLRLFFAQLSSDRGVEIAVEMICHDQPRKADERIVKAIAAACGELGVRYHSMVSGAYHDAMMVARFAPIGMIFVPSRGGISHDPQEWSDYSDIATGTDILAETLLQMSKE
jgi:hydantoinase/carbamoylase family amidase